MDRKKLVSEAKKLYKKHGNIQHVANELKVGWHTVNRIIFPEKEGVDPNKPENEDQELKSDLIDAYFKALKKLGRYPTPNDFNKYGINRNSATYHFGNLTNFKEAVIEKYGEQIEDIIIDERVLFTPHRLKTIDEVVGKKKRFFISSIVADKDSHKNFMKAIDSYCEKNDAVFIGLVCKDAWSRRADAEWSVHKDFKDRMIIADDVRLHRNFLLSAIKISAKQINPITGLARIGQREGSFLYASPKQNLEFTATDNTSNHALMTPGAVTLPDYDEDRYMSQRSSYIAENDHVLGGIIVEIDDDDNVHFRQVQANPKTGSFADLDTRYFANGKTKKERCHFAFGDWHSCATDPVAYAVGKDICKALKIHHMFLHDFFDGFSISHHDHGLPGIKARREQQGYGALDVEIMQGADDLNELQTWCSGDLVMVKSNHDEVLDRWLREGRYINEPQNYRIGHEMALAVLDGYDPLEFAYNNYTVIKNPNRIKWLTRKDSYKIGGVEMGAHGDLGANGSRGSLQSLEKAFGHCVVGHAHSAAILRGVWRVGTWSKLDLEYNRGPSSWTHTGCLIRDDGSRQLIHVINGRWRR